MAVKVRLYPEVETHHRNFHNHCHNLRNLFFPAFFLSLKYQKQELKSEKRDTRNAFEQQLQQKGREKWKTANTMWETAYTGFRRGA